MKNKRLSDSFKNAWNGLKEALGHERNMRLHLLAALLCVILGFVFCLDVIRWALLFLAIGLVIVAELVNTAIENLVDMITHGYCEKARAIKDIAAGAVLAATVTAVILGVLVFIHPLLQLVGLL